MKWRSERYFYAAESFDGCGLAGSVAKYILDSGLAKMEFVNKWVNHFEEYKASLEPYTLEYAEKVTGIPASTLTTGGA